MPKKKNVNFVVKICKYPHVDAELYQYTYYEYAEKRICSIDGDAAVQRLHIGKETVSPLVSSESLMDG
jgi:hypothetical protein